MASFQAKIGWKMPKRRENKRLEIIVTFGSHSMRNLKLQKNSNKIQKIKIYYYGFISSQNRSVKARKEKK